jgi:hypothetical protein
MAGTQAWHPPGGTSGRTGSAPHAADTRPDRPSRCCAALFLTASGARALPDPGFRPFLPVVARGSFRLCFPAGHGRSAIFAPAKAAVSARRPCGIGRFPGPFGAPWTTAPGRAVCLGAESAPHLRPDQPGSRPGCPAAAPVRPTPAPRSCPGIGPGGGCRPSAPCRATSLSGRRVPGSFTTPDQHPSGPGHVGPLPRLRDPWSGASQGRSGQALSAISGCRSAFGRPLRLWP